MKIEIYGCAHTSGGRLIDLEGEATSETLHDLVSETLNWEQMDLKSSDQTEEESECNWLVEVNGKLIMCETNRELQVVVKTILILKGE